MVESGLSLKYVVVEDVFNDVELCVDTEGTVRLLLRRNVSIILSPMRLSGYRPFYLT